MCRNEVEFATLKRASVWKCVLALALEFRLTWFWGTRLGCEETRCKAGSSEGLKKVPGKKITPPDLHCS
jgi:hypothetical protein